MAACTALVAEIEVLEGHLRKLQAEWDVLASEEASRAGSRTRVLSTLEGNVESTEKAIADYDKRTGQVTSAIEAMVEPMSVRLPLDGWAQGHTPSHVQSV